MTFWKIKNSIYCIIIYNKFIISMRTCCTACIMSIDETNKKIYFAKAGESRVFLYKKGAAEVNLKSISHKWTLIKLEFIKQMVG